MTIKNVPAIQDKICERIAKGESLGSICAAKDMPSYRIVCKWLEKNEAFVQKYARAREEQAEHYAQEIVGIADESGFDVILNEDGTYRVDGEAVNRSRLRVEARKWVASKLLPKKYGDKLDVEVDARITVQVLRFSPDPEDEPPQLE